MLNLTLAYFYLYPAEWALIWIVGSALVIAMHYFGFRYLGVMKTSFLSFELGLTIVWFWATAWQFSLMNEPTSDGGTIIGGLVFLAFGIGTAWMLCHEAITTARSDFGVELNLFRRFKVAEKLAARMGPTDPQEVPYDLPQE